jgi:hypothetical protein
MKTCLGGSKVAFKNTQFTLAKIVAMWHLTNYVIHALSYAYGSNIGKPPYRYNVNIWLVKKSMWTCLPCLL